MVDGSIRGLFISIGIVGSLYVIVFVGMCVITTSRKIIFYDNFMSFWMCHSKHSCQLGCVIPNIYVTLDISCHFGQCYKRPCFLLVYMCV